MQRADWQNVFKKRFVLMPPDENSKPGESSYYITDKELLVLIRAATPTGALRALSLTDTEECLVVNRGQGRYAFVDWDEIEAIATVDA